MGWLRALVAVVCCCGVAVGAVGCTDDGPSGPSGPSPSVSTSAAGSPTGSVTGSVTGSATGAPVAPVLPAAAKVASEAGARAFIAYYWDLINYAQVTGDVVGLRKVSGPNCDGCRGGINAITGVYRDGGSAKGGKYSVVIERLSVAKFSGARAFEGLVRVKNDEQVITRADGTTRILEPTRNSITVYLLWTGAFWRMDVLVVR